MNCLDIRPGNEVLCSLLISVWIQLFFHAIFEELIKVYEPLTVWLTTLSTLCLFFGFTVPVATAETVRAAIQPVKARQVTRHFTLSNSLGQLVSTSQYQGTVLVLNFWATECGGCRLEIPTFIDLKSAYQAQNVTVLGVAMDVWFEQLKDSKEGWNKVNPFVAAHGINYTMLMGDDAVKTAFHITELPVTVLIDRSGRIATTYVGIVDQDNLKSNINALLAER